MQRNPENRALLGLVLVALLAFALAGGVRLTGEATGNGTLASEKDAAGPRPTGPGGASSPAPVAAPQGSAVVLTLDAAAPRQVIRGFGVSTGWSGSSLATLPDLLFCREARAPRAEPGGDEPVCRRPGIGLSMVRGTVAPNPEWERSTAAWEPEAGQLVQAVLRGASVPWATVRTPPAQWKANQQANCCTAFINRDNRCNGVLARATDCTLLPAHLRDEARHLARFAAFLDAALEAAARPAGLADDPDHPRRLFALSPQSGPDAPAAQESSSFEPAALAAFVREQLKPALEERRLTTRIVAPESATFDPAFTDAALGDAQSAAAVGIVGGHLHGSGARIQPLAKAAALDKELWVTEADQAAPGVRFDPGMDAALRLAQQIHQALTAGEVSAFHWGRPVSQGDDNGGLVSPDGRISRRLWALGNFSRFVQPLDLRLAVTGETGDEVLISAYRNGPATRLVLVGINLGAAEARRSLQPNHFAARSLRAWLTAEGSDARGAPFELLEQEVQTVGEGALRLVLPPRSVTTWVAE